MQRSGAAASVARPNSPLSPRFEAPAHFEPLRSPSPRSMVNRAGLNQRRGNSNTLKLPPLPRYHPSNFQNTHSNFQSTPDSGRVSPQPPVSPRSHQRTISDAQKRLFAYQREMVSAATRSSISTQLQDPEGPRLHPLGSPGPVTPLELEAEDGGYITAGIRNATNTSVPSEELVTKLMTEEVATKRRHGARQMNR